MQQILLKSNLYWNQKQQFLLLFTLWYAYLYIKSKDDNLQQQKKNGYWNTY